MVRYLSYFGAFLARFFLFPLYFLSGLVGRRSDLWVFGSWGGYRFADNAAAFFAFCQDQIGDTVELVWISRDQEIVSRLQQEGFKAYRIWSPSAIYYCAKAGLYVFDSFSKDINYWLSRGARKVNVWSGVPLKTFERDIDNPRSRYYRLFYGLLPERLLLGMLMPWHLDRPDLIIATSPETQEITRRAFDLKEEQVIVTGFPRNDIFFRQPPALNIFSNHSSEFASAVHGNKKIFLYLPTYRDSGKPFLNVDWAKLDNLMKHLSAVFFFKFHPDDRGRFEGGSSNIVELPQDTDIYEMLLHTDALISDYSSIIFDYMLLDRPIIYYMPDLDEFISSSRSLNFDPLEIAVGPACSTGEELMQALSEVARGLPVPDDEQAHRAAVRKRLNTYVDGYSNRRVLDAIDEKLLNGFVTKSGGLKASIPTKEACGSQPPDREKS